MGQAKLKTTATAVNVADFIAAVPDHRRRADALALDALYRKVTGCEPRMWGPSIVGYGSYDYRYESGREGTMARAAFSPRKSAAVLYLSGTSDGPRAPEAAALFARLGPHTMKGGCLHIRRLDAIDLGALEGLVRLSWDTMNERWPD